MTPYNEDTILCCSGLSAFQSELRSCSNSHWNAGLSYKGTPMCFSLAALSQNLLNSCTSNGKILDVFDTGAKINTWEFIKPGFCLEPHSNIPWVFSDLRRRLVSFTTKILLALEQRCFPQAGTEMYHESMIGVIHSFSLHVSDIGGGIHLPVFIAV